MGDPHIHTLDGNEFDLYDKGTYSVFHYGGTGDRPSCDFPRFWCGLAADLLMAWQIAPVVDHLGMRFTLQFLCTRASMLDTLDPPNALKP